MAERVSPRRTASWAVIDLLVVVYALFPVLWILSLSLKPTSTVKDGKLIPSQITFDNYKGIFTGDVFSSALINSIGIGLITTVIAVVVGGMAAYAVARLDFAGKKALIGAALLIAMFPQISLVTPLFNIGLGSAISVLVFASVAVIAFIYIKLFGASAPGADNEVR